MVSRVEEIKTVKYGEERKKSKREMTKYDKNG